MLKSQYPVRLASFFLRHVLLQLRHKQLVMLNMSLAVRIV
jgi:hypothetical protein